MKMKNKMKIIIRVSFVIIIIVNLIGKRGTVIEELNLPNSIGYDILEKKGDQVLYSVPLRTYFSESKMPNESQLVTSKAINLGETRNKRQLQASKEFILGLEKSLIISEKTARFGISNIIDILLNNPLVNDNAKMVVCAGTAKDVMEYEVKKYSGTEEYVGTLVEHLNKFNFFSEKYSLIDFIIKSSSEGKNPIIPYLDIVEDQLKITGVAIFDKTKMVKKLDIEDVKVLNLLRENKGKGILTIQKNSKEYINYYPQAKKKVKCYKEDNKYKFIINITLKGPIISNQLYKNLNNDPKVLKKFENDMEESVEKKCTHFISKMKDSCKVDVLELGNVAAAKYGRETGVDWNKEVLNSEIKVNVKVKVDSQGRGDY
ncbi:Ger(x)C family spore germination protein [Clostridium botulinum]|nr:Ger(x)C family spore germination protein [Clostridium botulinum]NFB52256.1 Ger(x)C family spore germination protein [Clostridium botulinum]NFC27420.1 Ger(x)C family spore germination protein [Clostridium botulinum]NFC63112.1 Ger(x)C family spore germination protein [Clostridium botulinum]NFC68126.1 Ger(x)C family spore germination protein [Clostridium botulinum]